MTSAAEPTIYKTPVKDLSGKDLTLGEYQGKVLLIVNVASKCGMTPQYSALQSLHAKYAERGFSVLGFPCNQFLGQEPGTPEQIAEFCKTKYNVTFPLFAKSDVNGPSKNPLYELLTGTSSPFPGPIRWNFTKFLIGRDGTILARFEPRTKPDSPEVTAAIEKALDVPKP